VIIVRISSSSPTISYFDLAAELTPELSFSDFLSLSQFLFDNQLAFTTVALEAARCSDLDALTFSSLAGGN
jgi:hypothetical protein